MLQSREARVRLALASAGLLAFVAMLAIEVATDDEPVRALDLAGDALQMALLVATAVACALLAVRVQSQRDERLSLLRDLELARAEGEAWRRDARAHLEGLGVAIERQFESWRLTEAEREIGLLMLKGFSHKEIGALRGTTDATVRHQAKAIYQKAGVESRTSFCAFFLEDLLPGDASGARTPAREAARPRGPSETA
ncbi:MAG TPA: LuxR family transcriptional regulator [Myxococcota bacterium]|jgi:DNA-binding CsgD family transcriptional regulator|nr:LuxR family transcriptional regulator [Myxococcota bacterium]